MGRSTIPRRESESLVSDTEGGVLLQEHLALPILYPGDVLRKLDRAQNTKTPESKVRVLPT